MAGDADEPCFALLLCLDKGLDSAARPEDVGDIPFLPHVMHLPEVQMVGLHVRQRLMQMGQRALFVAVVGFAGEEDLLPPLPERLPVINLAS